MTDIFKLTTPVDRPDITHYKLTQVNHTYPRSLASGGAIPGKIEIYLTPQRWNGSAWVALKTSADETLSDTLTLQFVFDEAGSNGITYDQAIAALNGTTWAGTETYMMSGLAAIGFIPAGAIVDYDTPPA